MHWGNFLEGNTNQDRPLVPYPLMCCMLVHDQQNATDTHAYHILPVHLSVYIIRIIIYIKHLYIKNIWLTQLGQVCLV
jgi:hypothetical protein